MKTMMKIVLVPVVPGNVKTMKLTLISPPFPEVGTVLHYLGAEWTVIKATKTRGTILKTGVVYADKKAK